MSCQTIKFVANLVCATHAGAFDDVSDHAMQQNMNRAARRKLDSCAHALRELFKEFLPPSPLIFARICPVILPDAADAPSGLHLYAHAVIMVHPRCTRGCPRRPRCGRTSLRGHACSCQRLEPVKNQHRSDGQPARQRLKPCRVAMSYSRLSRQMFRESICRIILPRKLEILDELCSGRPLKP